ncbi:MAG TPA: single-stranded-DNA-specific exonuclease RecJ [Alphaproteobacteria bacterium]|nr:single-stranded-DNA-specific exonuclease RecJ [Alphaproteobacteria bacterium]
MQSITGKIWNLKEPNTKDIMYISQRLGVSEIIARVLLNRDVSIDDAKNYLEGSLADMPDPYHFKDMVKATDRIIKAINEKQKIAIFGDYDVDGSCASAILTSFFNSIGIDTTLYIPDRMTEGYGPNEYAFKKLKSEGHDLVITVDCGCVAFDSMKVAKEIGLDIIITDHHQCEVDIPECIGMVNPNRVDEDGLYGYLCGATVAFLLAVAVNRQIDTKVNMKMLLDLVAVATVCDLVPLKGINRVLVDRGLKVLATRQNIGLKALADITGIDERPRAYHCGFVLGPRINAAGRISSCDLGSRLLSTKNISIANKLAAELHDLNAERKEIETIVQEEAILQAEKKVAKNPDIKALVLAGENWHAGVIGIVASRIKELYNLPVFIIALDDKVCKGSGRSISGVDLGAIVRKSKDILIGGGGHGMAAGLSIDKEQIPAFEKRFCEVVEKAAAKNPEILVPKISLDGVLNVGGANLDLISKLEKVEPYGMGNPEPKFAVTGRVAYAQVVGEKHVRITLTDLTKRRVNGIVFSAMETDLGPFLLNSLNEQVTVCGQIKRNVFNGYESAQIQVLDAIKGEMPNS